MDVEIEEQVKDDKMLNVSTNISETNQDEALQDNVKDISPTGKQKFKKIRRNIIDSDSEDDLPTNMDVDGSSEGTCTNIMDGNIKLIDNDFNLEDDLEILTKSRSLLQNECCENDPTKVTLISDSVDDFCTNKTKSIASIIDEEVDLNIAQSKSNNLLVNRKSKPGVIDSDSDDDNILQNEGESSSNLEDPLIHEDSDQSHIALVNDSIPKRKSKTGIIDSDSDCEDVLKSRNWHVNRKSKSRIPDSDSDCDDNIENNSKVLIRKGPLSESASDNENNDHYDETKTTTKFAYKSNIANADNAVITKPTNVKEAMNQRNEIYSESQRRLRETNISLPYHIPKSRTIKEFLTKRPKFAINLTNPKKMSASIAIKMSKSQLEIVSKKLEEREKELEEFYKSESEDEDAEKENKDVTNIDNTIQMNEDKDTNDGEFGDKILETEDNLCADKGTTSQEETVDKAKVTKNVCEDIQNELENANDNLDMLIDTRSKLLKDDHQIDHTENVANITESELESSNLSSGVDLIDKQLKDNHQTDNVSKEADELEFNLQGLDSDEEDAANSNNKVSEEKPNCNLNKLAAIKERLIERPRLSGGPNDIIDLDASTLRPSGVSKLMERFIKHNAKKIPVKHDVHVSVLNVDHGEIHKEVLNMTVESDDTGVIQEAPGFRLKKLRAELQNQMAQKRTEQWEHKNIPNENDMEECKNISDEDDDEEGVADANNDLENIEEEQLVADNDGNDDVSEADAETDPEEDDEEYEEPINVIDYETEHNNKRKLKRIIRPFEDSDDEDEQQTDNAVLKVYKTKNDMDEDFIPPNLPRENATPVKYTQSLPLSCITPITAYNTQSFRDSPSTIGAPSPLDNTPMKEVKTTSTRISKMLFEDNRTQLSENMEDLAALCSGSFPTQSDKVNESWTNANKESHDITLDENGESLDTLQNLEDLCSGKFATQTQLTSNSIKSYNLTPFIDSNKSIDGIDNVNITSKNQTTQNDIESSIDIVSQVDFAQKTSDFIELSTRNDENFMRIDDSEKELISQLLNEEEVLGGGRIYDDSDDEDNTQIKQKQTKKLDSSDDETENEEEDENQEVIDLNDEDIGEEEENFEVDYDSEENEVPNDKSESRRGLKLGEFIEKEAELSGSEWDSEDEDERNLDSYDIELGDEDQFDKDKLHNDLEKIHMRTMLDEDKRDVKFLQELLLEDGELHGAGRQRQFRWKNIDALNNDENDKKDEDEDAFYETESNEDLVKMRHQRELFLQKMKDKEESNLLIETSHLLKLGQKVSKYPTTNINLVISKEDEEKKSILTASKAFTMTYHKGSFLNRKQEVLNRIAEFTKINGSSSATGKQTRNFVFQSVDIQGIGKEGKKRKASESTPKALKKLRLSNKTSKLAEL